MMKHLKFMFLATLLASSASFSYAGPVTVRFDDIVNDVTGERYFPINGISLDPLFTTLSFDIELWTSAPADPGNGYIRFYLTNNDRIDLVPVSIQGGGSVRPSDWSGSPTARFSKRYTIMLYDQDFAYRGGTIYAEYTTSRASGFARFRSPSLTVRYGPWLLGNTVVNGGQSERAGSQPASAASPYTHQGRVNPISKSYRGLLASEGASGHGAAVYPNPTIGPINFVVGPTRGGDAKITIYTPGGAQRVVYDGKVPEVGQISLNLPAGMAKGLYYYRVSGGASAQSGKFLYQ